MDDLSIWPLALTVGATLGMVAAWWAGRKGWTVFRRMDEPLSARVDELTLEVVELRLELSKVMVGAARLVAQLEQERIEPEYRPPLPRKERLAADEESDVVRLHRLLVESFSQEELDDLAMTTGVPAESYGGSTRSARALALVQVAARHGLLQELVSAARQMRPRVKWPRMMMD